MANGSFWDKVATERAKEDASLPFASKTASATKLTYSPSVDAARQASEIKQEARSDAVRGAVRKARAMADAADRARPAAGRRTTAARSTAAAPNYAREDKWASVLDRRKLSEQARGPSAAESADVKIPQSQGASLPSRRVNVTRASTTTTKTKRKPVGGGLRGLGRLVGRGIGAAGRGVGKAVGKTGKAVGRTGKYIWEGKGD